MKTVKEWLVQRKMAKQFKKEVLRDGDIIYWRLKDKVPFSERSFVKFFQKDGQDYHYFITAFCEDEIHVEVSSSQNKFFKILLPINDIHTHNYFET